MTEQKNKKLRYPSSDSKDEAEQKAARWINDQQRAHREGRLSKSEIRKLELLPGWSWD